MDCTKCTTKGCRKALPCVDRSAGYLENYLLEDTRDYIKAASLLVDDGRAGTLTRIEEIVEYFRFRGYTHIGAAYCYGMEKEAGFLREYLGHEGFRLTMVSCTVDGIKESQIDNSKSKGTVSCNPLGQANILNSSGAQFVILMGLCLGHDILLQKNLKMDFTTFVVKDRVTRHDPLVGLPGFKRPEDTFLESMPANFNLIKAEEFKTRLESNKSPEDFYLLDLRNSEAFARDGIPGSINCLLNNLPNQYHRLLPDKRKEVVVYCNGGIQSIYGAMYLSLKGYTNVKSLAGGYSRFL